MRVLTSQEMSWIAGGYDSVDPITVEPPVDDGGDDPWDDDDPWEDPWGDPEDPTDPWGDTGGGGGSGDPPPAPDMTPTVSYDPTVPGAKEAADKLKAQIAKVDDKIDALPADQLIRMPNGQLITSGEFKSLWEGLSFKVDAKNYGADRGGANDGGVVGIHVSTVDGYAAHGENGLTFLLLHEVAHNTAYGHAQDLYHWQHFLDTKTPGQQYDASSVDFVSNEMVANTIARDIAAQTGISYGNYAPTHGYIQP